MIWVLSALAQAPPDPAAVRDAARLRVDEEKLEGVTGVHVEATLFEGLPWIQVRNKLPAPLTIRWSESRITPPNGTPVPMFARLRSEHDPARPVVDEPDTVLMPGGVSSWAVFPVPWADDGPDDDQEQLQSWALTSFSGIELALARGDDQGTYSALWRTEIDLEALAKPSADLGPLAIPAAPVPAPVPLPEIDLEARQKWDRDYRMYRKQGKTARSVWIAGVVVGSLSALGVATTAQSYADAPAVGEDAQGYTRADYRESLFVYGAITGASVGVTIPMVLVERAANRKLRELGRRP